MIKSGQSGVTFSNFFCYVEMKLQIELIKTK